LSTFFSFGFYKILIILYNTTSCYLFLNLYSSTPCTYLRSFSSTYVYLSCFSSVARPLFLKLSFKYYSDYIILQYIIYVHTFCSLIKLVTDATASQNCIFFVNNLLFRYKLSHKFFSVIYFSISSTSIIFYKLLSTFAVYYHYTYSLT